MSFNVGDTVTALYDFVKEEPGDLNVWSGDTLTVVDNNVGEGWVMAQNVQSMEQGLVPSSYVQITGTQTLFQHLQLYSITLFAIASAPAMTYAAPTAPAQ